MFKVDDKSAGSSPLHCFSCFYWQVLASCCYLDFNFYCVTICSISFSKDKRICFFVSCYFFLTTLNRFSLVNFSSIRFIITQSLFFIYICTEDGFAIKSKILQIFTVLICLPDYKMNFYGLPFVLFRLKWSAGKGFISLI